MPTAVKNAPIIEYTDAMFEEMREFYFQTLYESHHFLPYTPKMNQGYFNSRDRLKFVIKKEKIIAHLTLSPNTRDEFSIGVAVLKEFYGKGLGSRLLDFAEEISKEKGIKALRASVHFDNWRSLLLFVKHGYKVINDEGSLTLYKEL